MTTVVALESGEVRVLEVEGPVAHLSPDQAEEAAARLARRIRQVPCDAGSLISLPCLRAPEAGAAGAFDFRGSAEAMRQLAVALLQHAGQARAYLAVGAHRDADAALVERVADRHLGRPRGLGPRPRGLGPMSPRLPSGGL